MFHAILRPTQHPVQLQISIKGRHFSSCSGTGCLPNVQGRHCGNKTDILVIPNFFVLTLVAGGDKKKQGLLPKNCIRLSLAAWVRRGDFGRVVHGILSEAGLNRCQGRKTMNAGPLNPASCDMLGWLSLD